MGTDWISERNRDESLRLVTDVSGLLRGLGGEVTGHLCDLVAESRYKEVVEFKFNYSGQGLRDVMVARQVQALLSKQGEWLDLGYDVNARALAKFYEAEDMCRKTNDRLDSTRPHGRVSVVSHYAQRKISEVLGDVPSLSELMFSFGPGANTSVKGSVASPRAKLGARLACSEDMLPFVGDFLAEAPLWAWSHIGKPDFLDGLVPDRDYRVFPEIEVHDGKLTFVPKDARTKRSIVVEPILNGFCQKGVGTYIRDRLLRVSSQNLRDQKRNQELARLGSIHGHLATVDLSSASDTIALMTIFELLPLPWAEFLSKLRTPVVVGPQGRISLEKFSSMGNAFTFELESLLFYALTYGVCRCLDLSVENVSIYGDDIIIPSEGYPLLVEVLDYYGFTVNTEKSFVEGPFRESCGADWFEGMDIRPFYLRSKVSDRVLYTFHNWAMRSGERELASLLHDWTYPPIRLYGPDGYGDGHLVGTYNLRVPRRIKRNGWEGGFFDTYSLRPKRIKKRYAGDWVFPSYSVYTRSGERDPTDPDIVRGSSGYAKVSIYTLATSIFGR